MPHAILFIFCIAFLSAAGGWMKTGMALFAIVHKLLARLRGGLVHWVSDAAWTWGFAK